MELRKIIHHWLTRTLEEPFYRAELHRVEMVLPENKAPGLKVIKGGNKRITVREYASADEIRKICGKV